MKTLPKMQVTFIKEKKIDVVAMTRKSPYKNLPKMEVKEIRTYK